MLKERLDIARNITGEVHGVEAAVDNTIIALGGLLAALPKAQTAAKLSAVVGDRAYAHLSDALAKLFGVRSALVAMHHELDNLKGYMGLRNVVVDTGDLVKVAPGTGAELETADVVVMRQAQAA